MEFTCTVSVLREAVSAAASAVPSTPTQVAYSAVLIGVTREGDLTVTGTDGDTTVVATARIAEPVAGQVLLVPRQLSAWLAQRDARHVIRVSASADAIFVRPERGGAYSFRTMNAQLTPPVARGELRPADLSGLKAAVGAVRSATDRRSPLVHVRSGEPGSVLQLQATDMYRVARARLDGASWGPFEGVLPLAALERIVRADAGQMAVDERARMVRAVGEGVEVSARLSATAFPPTDDMFEHAALHQVDVPRSDLTSALAGVSAAAGDATVHVTVDGSRVTLEASNVDTGSGSEQVTLAGPVTSSVDLHVKPLYLAEALAAIPSAQVQWGWSSPSAAIRLMGSQDGLDVAVLVMPVRVS